MTNIALGGGREGKALFLATQESSGLNMGFHPLVGKMIELKSSTAKRNTLEL